MSQLQAPYTLEYAYKRSLGATLSAFFSALHRKTILGAKTARGAVICPPQDCDPLTGDANLALVPVGPNGTITALSWVDAPRPQHPLDRPFAYALIRLDGADTAMLHVVDAEDPQAIRVGARVHPRWASEPVGGMLDIEAFALGEADVDAAEGSETRAESENVAPITKLVTPIHLDYTVTAGQVQSRFLTALTERKLLGSVDADTGEVYVPMRACSPVSGKPCTEVVEVAQEGVVTTFCVVRIPFEGQRIAPPYVCAQVMLDGADTPLFHLVGGCSVDDVHIGMRVRAVWVDDAELAPTLESIQWFAPAHGERQPNA